MHISAQAEVGVQSIVVCKIDFFEEWMECMVLQRYGVSVVGGCLRMRVDDTSEEERKSGRFILWN